MKKLSIAGVIAGVAVAGLLAGAMILYSGLTGRDATASGPNGSGTPLGSWVLTSWSDPAKLPGVAITMNVEATLVNGVSACNNYSGPVTVEGEKFTTGLMATTMMFCADTAEAETTYLELLATVTTWARDGDSLVLSRDGIEILRFDRA